MGERRGIALRASFYSRRRRFFDLLVELAMEPGSGDNPAANGLLAAERGRGRALLDLLAEGSLLQQLPPDLMQRRIDNQRKMGLLSAQLLKVKPGQEAALRDRLELLAADDDRIESHIRESAAELPTGQPLESIESLQKGLPSDSALLEFHLATSRSYLWFVDRQQVRVFTLPGREIIEKQAVAINGLGQILERERSLQKQAAFDHALKRLSPKLFGPLAGQKLPRRIVLALDGALLRVPFAAPRLPGQAEPLGLTRDLIRVPSAGYLLAGRKPRPVRDFPKTILALADPVFSANDSRVVKTTPDAKDKSPQADLARLPFFDDLDAIRALTPPGRRTILSGFEVNRAAIEKLHLSDYAVLHLSTHALIDDTIPEVSRVALSLVDHSGHAVDGYLRPYQLARLRLNGSVVVLSACDTALGKQVLGEGLAGLTSSLFYGGAAQLVLTLTEVDAEPSAKFFAEVYRQYLGPRPMGMEHSLTLARQSMARSRRWSDPYYWASYVVAGRPSPSSVS